MQKAAKEKSFILWIVASVALFFVPSFASSIDVEHGKNRVELFLLEGENRVGSEEIESANRVEKYDSPWEVALESPVAPKGGNIDMRWKSLPTDARKAVNDVMTEFGSGPDGARKLLEQARSGARPRPSTISDDTLRVYRDFVQEKFDELSKLRPDKNIDVMRDRLEIYRLWLGE